MADCAVSTDMLGDAGTPPSPTPMRIAALMCCAAVKGPPAAAAGGRSWHVAEEMAEARETGMRQRPFPCRYCMAAPMSSSISLATCCSVTVRPSLPSAAPAAAPPRPCKHKHKHTRTWSVSVQWYDVRRPVQGAAASFRAAAREPLWHGSGYRPCR
uniref:Uncharacterized protein n=1 Tax=Aegilops tauschii subsp. strangulata TaxID=200361 RepID=A0A453KXB8_AEGTS